MKCLRLFIPIAAAVVAAPLLAQNAPESGADVQILLPDPPAAAPSPPPVALDTTAPAPSRGPLPAIGTWSRSGTAGAAQTLQWDVGLRVIETPSMDRAGTGASYLEPGILRLTGEDISTSLALYIPAEAPQPTSFRLILRNSVNNLPSRSSVTVNVNGQEAGTWPLSNIGDFGKIDVPGMALKGGINRVDLALRQHHRIFCGPVASFQVWTDIDLPASGVTLSAGSVQINADSFHAGLINIVQRGEQLDVRMQDGVPDETLTAVMAAVGKGLNESASVRVRSPYEPEDRAGRRVGISLRQGTGGPSEVTFLRSPHGALVMQVTDGTGLAELLANTLPPAPAAEDLTRLTPGRETSFQELGAPVIVRNTHYALADVPFTLPRDWMNLSSQRALLTLNYGYAENLPQGAVLLVKVNDETILLLPLDVEGGKVQRPLPVRFPVNLLHGGRNMISFEMIVPGDPPTLECPARDADMLVILNSSTLNIPPTPPMTRGTRADELNSIGPDDVTMVVSEASPSFLRTFIGQMAMSDEDRGTARLFVARLPQDSSALSDQLPLSREQIVHLFQSQRGTPPQQTDAPQFFRLNDEAASSEDATSAEPDASGFTHIWRAQIRSLVAPEGPPLTEWIFNRSATAVLMAPDEADEAWTLVADGQLRPEVLAASLDAFRESQEAQGSRVALRLEDGSWQTWPPNPRPQVTGHVPFRQIFQVVGNFASWAPGFYAILLIALALLSAVPALLYVISTRKDRTL